MGLGREDLWRALTETPGPDVEQMIVDAYTLELHREWSLGDRSPHGHAWHTSFHASEFPGEDRLACARRAVYGLLDPPAAQAREPKLQAWFDLGTNLEHDWVRRWSAYGVLLSADVTVGAEHQTGFVDAEHWLTGSSDAILLLPERGKARCVEVKTTSHEKVLKMLNSNGADVPKQHAKYLRQLGVYVGLAHEAPFSPHVTVCEKSGLLMNIVANGDADRMCPAWRTNDDRPHPLLHEGECNPVQIVVTAPDDGTLIYSSREEPLLTVSFRVNYDVAFMAAGRARLDGFRQALLEDRIPEHPHEGAKAKWGVEPCQWCPLKKDVCKPDYQQKVGSLRDSNLIGFSQQIAPTWDYDEKRNAVLQRWGVKREEPQPA